MNNKISIEYCTSWNYITKAVGLTESLLNEHKQKLKEVSIIPSSGGVFEVKFNDELIFSKKELGRFPEKDEVEEKVNDKI